TASAPPPTAPRRPPICGSAPERNPRTTARTTSETATRSSGFTARSSHRGHENAPDGSSGAFQPIGPGRRRRASASADRYLDRRREGTRVDQGVGAGRHGRDLELGLVLLGDRDAEDLLRAVPFAEGDGELGLPFRDLDRIEDVAWLDATGPGRSHDDRGSVHAGGKAVGRDRVDIELPRLRDDELATGFDRDLARAI